MDEVWAIVEERDIVSGHGESADTCQLQGPNCYSVKELYPVFTTEEKANKFINGEKLFCAKTRRLEVR
jgi:hypothetical protein